MRCARWLAPLLWLTACSPGTDAPPGEPSPYLPASGYCEAIVEPFCDFYLRCGRTTETTLEGCRDQVLTSCNGRYERTYLDLEAAGLLRLSRAGVSACAEHLAAVSCDEQFLELLGVCGGMWEGTQPAGAACSFDVESFVCEPGTTCVLSLSLCGTCTPVVAPGEACGAGESCGNAASCEDEECVTRVPVGGSCAAGERCVLGASCAADEVCRTPVYVGVGDDCDLGHRCPYGSSCIGGSCKAAARLGEACGTDTPCENARCVGGECLALLEPGAPCSSGAECRTGICTVDGCSTVPGACFE